MNNSPVNLVQPWNELWRTFTEALGAPTLLTAAAWLGVGLIAFSIFKFLWQRSQGKGAPAKTLLFPALIGITLSAPELLFPLFLRLIELVAGLVVSLISGMSA